MNDNKRIGLKIFTARKNLKMSRVELGKLVNLHESTVKRYEDGEIKSLDIDKLKDFGKALNISPAELLGWDEKYNKDDVLIKEVEQISNFDTYLKSLGYKTYVNPLGEWTISKGNITATFTNEEFDHLKEMNATLLDSEIYKNSLKHYVPETLAAHRTDDCTQSIDESALTNSVQRLKDQAFEKHGVKYK